MPVNKILSAEQVAGFQQNGFLFPVRVLSDHEAEQYRAHVEELSNRMGKLRRSDQCHLFFRWAYDLVTHPKILDVIEDILGPDILVHSSRIFYKHPRDNSFVSWHVDGRYTGMNSYKMPTVWIALSDSIAENGCLRVVSGSHKQNSYPFIERPSENNLENHGQEITDPVDDSKIVSLILKSGEMSIHDSNMIHGSEPNRSDLCRIGFSVSYMTPEPRSSRLPVIRARGSADCCHLSLVDAIPDFDIDKGIAAQSKFLQERNFFQPRVS